MPVGAALRDEMRTPARLGEDEVAAGTVSLKDLRSGEQITVPAADAAERILADIELRGQGTILK